MAGIPQKNLRRDTGQAAQWTDITQSGRAKIDADIQAAGRNMPGRLGDRLDRLNTKDSLGPKEEVERKTLTKVVPEVRSRNVTRTTAANRRVEAYNRATDAGAAEGRSVPDGAGWYFEHHRDIAASASKHGVDRDRAIVASAVMSPLNSPENEKAAVSALMEAHSNGKVDMQPHLAARLRAHGYTVESHHEGRQVAASELSSDTLAGLSDTRVKDEAQPLTNMNLNDMARGGPKGNVVKANEVIRGNVHPDAAINPKSAPKIWSYAHNTREAVPDTAEHHEYMSRVADVAAGPAQPSLDLWGLRGSKKGLLGANSHTVEDTWMNSISHDQPNKTIPGTKTNVLKTAGSHPAANPGPTAAVHAFNNRATQQAANRLGRGAGHDFDLPPVSVQETAWTQVRREGGKDPQFNAAQESGAKTSRSQAFSEAATRKQGDAAQGTLF